MGRMLIHVVMELAFYKKACHNGHENIVTALHSNEADLSLCEEGEATHLYIACREGHEQNVILWLSKGAEINLCSKTGLSPLYIACQN